LRPKLLFFDVGETLVSEERMWGEWADWLKIPRFTLFAALGAVIEARQHHEEVFKILCPDVDLKAERAARAKAGLPSGFLDADLYPDTVATLRRAKEAGFRLGFAGNHPQRTEAFVRSIGIEADIVGSSERWGVSKPDPRFFQAIIDQSGLAPGEIAYIGDRIDNDVLPALRLGMQAVFIERGPWGVVQGRWPEAADVPHKIKSLGELPAVFGF
jgi:FMN phosphatase YigB (HAD superfamily)